MISLIYNINLKLNLDIKELFNYNKVFNPFILVSNIYSLLYSVYSVIPRIG